MRVYTCVSMSRQKRAKTDESDREYYGEAARNRVPKIASQTSEVAGSAQCRSRFFSFVKFVRIPPCEEGAVDEIAQNRPVPSLRKELRHPAVHNQIMHTNHQAKAFQRGWRFAGVFVRHARVQCTQRIDCASTVDALLLCLAIGSRGPSGSVS
jgi:hypothetical protein